MTGRGVQGRSGDDAGAELQREDGVHGVVDEGPRGVTQGFMLADAKETDKIVEDAIRLLELEIKAQRLEKHIFMVQDGISPLPELLGLLIDDHVGLFLRDPTARDHDFLHAPHVLLDLGRQEQRRRRNRVRVHAWPLREINHAEPHEEPVHVHRCRGERQLRQLQHDPHLRDEVDALAATDVFGLQLHAVELRWRPRELFVCEEPLGLYCVEDRVRWCWDKVLVCIGTA